ncbi:unnamed protein product [Anisakis simplex]|uniref:Transposase n=1 Tax=Anisakis simplex TaxID=6269 RepID=A0A0M3JQM3_ANISI|nr:unnamed protein product [Anisakis simplex]
MLSKNQTERLTILQVDACTPDVCIQWRSWSIADALNSTRLAMSIAEKHLDVASVTYSSRQIRKYCNHRCEFFIH